MICGNEEELLILYTFINSYYIVNERFQVTSILE